ncbi:hypothetical protein EPO15_14045 [bacterium]|nr:MAG: hypothetical protein EPO15_14045 [bacterium]
MRLRRPDVPTLLAFGSALAWMGAVYAAYFSGANTFEFGQYAEIGRNILAGHGFTTRVLYPSTLAALDGLGLARLEYTPVDHRFPLPAFLSALSQALLGETDFAAAAPTMVLFAAWVALAYAAAARWLGRREAALGAALFAAVPAGAKYFVLFTLPDVPFGALLFAFHWMLAEARPEDGRRRCAALGALGGLLYLCRFNFWVWLPLYAVVLWRTLGPRGRVRGLATFFGAFALVCAPAVLYKLRWFGALGTPDVAWNLAHQTTSADQPWLAFRTFSSAEVLSSAWRAVAAKSLDHLHTLLLEGPMLWQLQALIPFTALGLLRWPEGTARRFLALNLAALAWQAVAFAPLRFDSWGLGVGYRYFFWVCPLLVFLGLRGVVALVESLPEKARLPALGAWLALHAAFVVPFYTHDLTSIHVDHPSGLPPRQWPELAWLAGRANAGEGVVSNLPAQVGWYAGVSAVALPNDPEDVPKMAAVRPLRYLFVSTLNIGTLGDLPKWLDLLRPNLDGLNRYCAAHGYRTAAVMPGAVILDLKPAPENP